MEWRDHITVDPMVCHGQACVRGTRIPASVILDNLAAGFGDIRNYPSRDYRGIVILRPSSQDKPTVLRLFSVVIPMLEREPIVGRLWIVDDQRIRMRG